MLLRSSKYITNNIRRYTHTNNSPTSTTSTTYTILDEKLNKIMSKLQVIDFLVKCNYAVSVIPGLLLFFK
jgi:hypothetical protein